MRIRSVFGVRIEFVDSKPWKTQTGLVQIVLLIEEYETRPIMSKNYENKNDFKQIKCDLLYFLYGHWCFF